ncbi:hypothetical protein PENTCL1PPCAC_17420 [Pristionchus entomophagus]|uniref:ZMIZ1 N-terminal domain-containing protein n=1 Tax=Pristionchus entomophagus TaxID=358040 RepID=A0AAV5TLJ9_9BILA|nr:hypothetical protein PENTCL1PPCAC_17420 [Pristionchus entomophagus]
MRMESDSEEDEKRNLSLDEYGEHVRQNNLRLVTLTQCISKEVTFASACKELHEWCKDPRAFTSNFEENLIQALQRTYLLDDPQPVNNLDQLRS